MKKIIFTMLAISLIVLCFSGNLNAQASENELDQVELMKQLIGKWESDRGKVDSTIVWEIIPWNKGYETSFKLKAKGEVYYSYKGIWGFNRENTKMDIYYLSQNGHFHNYSCEFVSDKNMIIKAKDDHSFRDLHFITPDKFKWILKRKSSEDSWDNAVVTEEIYTRVK